MKLNDAEHAELARLLGTPRPVRALLDGGVGLVAHTHGKRGAELHTPSASVAHPGFPVEGSNGDAVGAGDAFTAALVLGLLQGAALPALLARANLHASLVAGHRGAMPEVDAGWRERLDREAPC